jgi:CRP/FNR family transcriptional regulator, cyclic AMP receptor protein
LTKQDTETAQLVRLLSRVPLFSELEKKELEVVAAAGKMVEFEPSQRILRRGERGLGFLLVLEGKTEVQKSGRSVAVIGPGGFFGEMTVIDDKPRSADVVAVVPTKCFGMASWSFFPVLRSHPSVAIGIIKELVRRLRQADEDTKD